jgi:membrane protein
VGARGRGLLAGLLLVFAQGMADWLGAAGFPTPPEGVSLWGTLAALAFGAAAGVYHLAPNVARPWRWVRPGAGLFALNWLVMTAGFAIFVTYFADFGVTHGALAGAVALLMWLYWTGYLLLAGAVFNAVLWEGRAGA